MYILYLNDEFGQSQKWWFNFLYSLSSHTILNDLESEFAKWNAKLLTTNEYGDSQEDYGDAIQFESEKDMLWFLLRWN